MKTEDFPSLFGGQEAKPALVVCQSASEGTYYIHYRVIIITGVVCVYTGKYQSCNNKKKILKTFNRLSATLATLLISC